MIELAGEAKPQKPPRTLYCACCHKETEHVFVKRAEAGHKSRNIYMCKHCESWKPVK